MKSEYENNFYPFYKIFSINNNINPTVDILIESIDKFSFGEEIEEGNSAKKGGGEEKIKKSSPNNYGLIIESNSKLEDINLNDIINNIFDINIINDMNNKNKGKICGLFNKEDFDVKIENKKNHKNNQLNDSFEKKYHNPLKNILDEDDDIPKKKDDHQNKNDHDSNANKEENKITNGKEDIQEDVKNEKELNNENNIIMIYINISNNLNNSNSKMKMNNYDTFDDKENEQKIKEINNPDYEIPFVGQLQEIKLNNNLNDDNNKVIKA